MSKNKIYKTVEEEPVRVAEPVAAYQTTGVQTSSSNDWNPNVPVHATQEEWWEHIHRIEEGNFMSFEEYTRKFDAWEKEYLASRLK